MTTIIFGCFKQSYHDLAEQESAHEYDTWCRTLEISEPEFADRILIYPEGKDYGFYWFLGLAALTADKIVFDVTHLKFPFNSGIITLNELWIVIHNKVLFDKTTFFVGGKEINKIKLAQLFIKDEAVTLSELQELFI